MSKRDVGVRVGRRVQRVAGIQGDGEPCTTRALQGGRRLRIRWDQINYGRAGAEPNLHFNYYILSSRSLRLAIIIYMEGTRKSNKRQFTIISVRKTSLPRLLADIYILILIRQLNINQFCMYFAQCHQHLNILPHQSELNFSVISIFMSRESLGKRTNVYVYILIGINLKC